MSRRDTIILAVLLNTGLLAVLFVIAINPESSHFAAPADMHQAAVEIEPSEYRKEPVPVILAHENKSDEVDNFLKDLNATMPLSHVAPLPVANTAKKQSFDEEMLAMHVDEPPQKTAVRREEPTQALLRYTDSQQYVEVKVKSGDILGRIAQANHTTITAIKQANNLTSDTLQVGQVLRIPVVAKKEDLRAATAKLTPSAVVEGYTRYYTIQSGDNPWKIAKKFNVSVRELLQLNDLDEAKAKSLRPGDRIRVQ